MVREGLNECKGPERQGHSYMGRKRLEGVPRQQGTHSQRGGEGTETPSLECLL